jgi:hypothetical protein
MLMKSARAGKARILVVIIAGLGLAGMLSLVTAVQEGPSKSRQVAGPPVGPAGQTGTITYLENPARPYSGGAQNFGPYRLIPPGSQKPTRVNPSDNPVAISDESVLQASSLYLHPLEGFAARRTSGVLSGSGEPIQVAQVWESEAGTVAVVVNSVTPESQPIDVALHFDDSPIEVRPVEIAGQPAILTLPRTGPAPNVGSVRVWLGSAELFLSSPDLDHDALTNLAAELVIQSR